MYAPLITATSAPACLDKGRISEQSRVSGRIYLVPEYEGRSQYDDLVHELTHAYEQQKGFLCLVDGNHIEGKTRWMKWKCGRRWKGEEKVAVESSYWEKRSKSERNRKRELCCFQAVLGKNEEKR